MQVATAANSRFHLDLAYVRSIRDSCTRVIVRVIAFFYNQGNFTVCLLSESPCGFILDRRTGFRVKNEIPWISSSALLLLLLLIICALCTVL